MHEQGEVEGEFRILPINVGSGDSPLLADSVEKVASQQANADILPQAR